MKTFFSILPEIVIVLNILIVFVIFCVFWERNEYFKFNKNAVLVTFFLLFCSAVFCFLLQHLYIESISEFTLKNVMQMYEKFAIKFDLMICYAAFYLLLCFIVIKEEQSSILTYTILMLLSLLVTSLLVQAKSVLVIYILIELLSFLCFFIAKHNDPLRTENEQWLVMQHFKKYVEEVMLPSFFLISLLIHIWIEASTFDIETLNKVYFTTDFVKPGGINTELYYFLIAFIISSKINWMPIKFYFDTTNRQVSPFVFLFFVSFIFLYILMIKYRYPLFIFFFIFFTLFLIRLHYKKLVRIERRELQIIQNFKNLFKKQK